MSYQLREKIIVSSSIAILLAACSNPSPGPGGQISIPPRTGIDSDPLGIGTSSTDLRAICLNEKAREAGIETVGLYDPKNSRLIEDVSLRHNDKVLLAAPSSKTENIIGIGPGKLVEVVTSGGKSVRGLVHNIYLKCSNACDEPLCLRSTPTQCATKVF